MLVQAEGPIQDLRSLDEEELKLKVTQKHLQAAQKQVGLVVIIRGGGETVTSLNCRLLNQIHLHPSVFTSMSDLQEVK